MPTMLVLGAGSGIARAAVREFAAVGWDFQLAGRDREALEAVAASLPVRASCFLFDAEDEASRAGLWPRLPEPPDALFCAVGRLGDQARARTDHAYARAIIECNFTGLIPILGQAAADFEARGRGLIIGISSVAGDRGRASNYVYGAAKAGFTAYLAGLRVRLCGRGVHVLTVKPGYVATRMIEGRPLPRWLVASPERVGRDICRAALRRRDVLYTPGWWRPVLAAYRALPECLAKRWEL